LFVKTFRPKSDVSAQWVTESKLEIPISAARGATLQLLFHPDSTEIFVYTSSTMSVVTIATKNVNASVVLDSPNRSYKWINHPLDQKLLIAIGPGKIQVRAWDDLREVGAFYALSAFMDHLTDLSFMTASDTEVDASLTDLRKSTRVFRSVKIWGAQETVDRVLLTSGAKYILVQTSHPVDRACQRHKQVIIFDVAALASSQPARPQSNDIDPSASTTSAQSTDQHPELDYITLPDNLASDIEILLAFLSRDRLVFLDHHYWVCSWRLP
jgi:hypothetical protein